MPSSPRSRRARYSASPRPRWRCSFWAPRIGAPGVRSRARRARATGAREADSAATCLELGVARARPAAARADRGAAPRDTIEARIADAWRLLADQLEPPGSRGRRSGARALLEGGDPGSAPDGGRRGAGWERSAGGREPPASPPGPAPHRYRRAAHAGRSGGAPAPLRRCASAARTLLELAPSFDAARHNYAVVLNRQGKAAAALPQVRAAAGQGAAQSGVSQPTGRGARELGRLRGIDRSVRGGTRGLSAGNPRFG